MTDIAQKYVTPEMRSRTVAHPELLCRLSMKCKHIAGDVAEVGVSGGGSAKILQVLWPDRQLWLFDTFTGNPSPGKRDSNKAGTFAAKEAKVREYLGSKNTHLCVGLFPGTAVECTADRFAFVHIDCDQEQSVMDSCEWFWPRLNGVMLFDDYGVSSCKGAKYAVDEFFKDKAIIHEQFSRGWVCA